MRLSAVVAACLVACLQAIPAPAGATIDRKGYAYALDGDALLYVEEHDDIVREGRVVRSTVTYRDPSGGAFATKRLDFSAEPTSPEFELENARTGHVEGAKRRGDALLVMFRKSDEYDLQQERLEPPGDAIIDGGFDRFIESNWSRLIDGEVFERPFLVPSFQRFVDFRIYLERRSETEVVFVMEPDSFLLRLVGGGIEVTYDRDSAALKRYEGVSNMRDPSGDNFKVRVEFPAAGSEGRTAVRAAPVQTRFD